MQARMHACTHAHAHTHARPHTHTHTHTVKIVLCWKRHTILIAFLIVLARDNSIYQIALTVTNIIVTIQHII